MQSQEELPLTKSNVGPAPFGYKREDGRLVLHPEEAPVRLRIFELFAEHERKKTVAGILNGDGHRTRDGVYFTSQTITRLLSDERVTGVPGEVEALIPAKLWERCNTILQSQKNKGGPARKVSHLFSGLIFCGCGQKMYVPSNTKKYTCSDCRQKITCDDLEEVFHSQLQAYQLNDTSKPNNDSLHKKWPHLSFDNKRRIAESVTQRIEVADKNVTCFLYSL